LSSRFFDGFLIVNNSRNFGQLSRNFGQLSRNFGQLSRNFGQLNT